MSNKKTYFISDIHLGLPDREKSLQRELKLVNFLDEIKSMTKIEIASDSKVNFLLIRHKEKDLFLELKKRNILVADFRNANGLENMNYVRIIMRSKEKLDILLDKLRQI